MLENSPYSRIPHLLSHYKDVKRKDFSPSREISTLKIKLISKTLEVNLRQYLMIDMELIQEVLFEAEIVPEILEKTEENQEVELLSNSEQLERSEKSAPKQNKLSDNTGKLESVEPVGNSEDLKVADKGLFEEPIDESNVINMSPEDFKPYEIDTDFANLLDRIKNGSR